jgi:translation initiation factor 3 subunit H
MAPVFFGAYPHKIRLSYAFCEVFAKDPEMVNSTFDRNKVFEEIPIKIIGNALATAFLTGLKPTLSPSYDHLDLASNAFLERNLEYLSGYMDELQNENGRIQHYQRQQARQQAQINAHLHKLRTENAGRRQKGLPLLPEDLSQFKKITPPSRLQSLVWMHQADLYVDQVDKFAQETSLKLFLVSELAKAQK